MNNPNRPVKTQIRPLASIPNKEGFELIGVDRQGKEALLVVYVDVDGFHKVPGYENLIGWKLA